MKIKIAGTIEGNGEEYNNDLRIDFIDSDINALHRLILSLAYQQYLANRYANDSIKQLHSMLARGVSITIIFQ